MSEVEADTQNNEEDSRQEQQLDGGESPMMEHDTVGPEDDVVEEGGDEGQPDGDGEGYQGEDDGREEDDNEELGDYGEEGDEEGQSGERDSGEGTSALNSPYDAPKEDIDDDMPYPNRLAMLSAGRSASASSKTSGPSSAVINLRGSRPNSAAIAQEIEGFEDDFMERVEEEEEGDYPEYAEEYEEEDLGPTVEELIERGQQEQMRLQELNEMLQKRARLVLDHRNKGRPPANRDLSMLDGVVTRYRSALKIWVDTLEERDRVEAHYQTTIFDMKSMLEDRIKRADDISKAYKHFKLEVAKSAEHSKTGRPISDRLLMHLEQEDQDKEEEVQRVRLKNIHLNNQLKRIEQTLKQKEELAEGLHLIDFEQLKIENQSLNEKIEERNEELLKLRKKTTTTVQILTHVREKLQFVEKENESLAEQLEQYDQGLVEKRDNLGKIKAARDAYRQKGRKIKQASVYITNPSLLDDIDVQKEKRDNLNSEIESLKQEYANLASTIERNNSKIVTMTEEMAASGVPNVMRALQTVKSSKTAA